MKRALLAALLGFAAVASSHATGYIIFDNYDSFPYMPIGTNTGHGFVGVSDPNIHVDLLYFLGTTGALTDLGLSVPIDPTLRDALPAGNQGYFQGGVVAIPGYVSGPVTFEVEAWLTVGPQGGPTYATSGFRGQSFLWTESSLATTGLPVNFFAGLPGPNGAPLIEFMPEPSLFALSGIGLAALILNRRRVEPKRSEDGRKQV
jgi:hypothetical protein